MHSQAFAPLIDAHIHLDKYTPEERNELLLSLPNQQVEAVIAVSMDLASAQANLELAKQYSRSIFPAFGYHPEQPLPSAYQQEQLFRWIEQHIEHAAAIGEVGLPIIIVKKHAELAWTLIRAVM